MTVINRERHQTTSVAAYNTLTVVASANSTGTIVRLGDSIGAPTQGSTAIAANESKVFGPFVTTTWFDLLCANAH